MAIIRKLFKNDFSENIDFLREQFEVDKFKSEVMIITPRRWGKCLGGDEQVLMADGSVRRAADICVGDQLVGDDGRARIVMNTCRGKAPMYRVNEASSTASEDASFTCNDAHLLVFEMRGACARLRRRPRALEVVERYFDELRVRERTTTYALTQEAVAILHVARLNQQERPSVTVRAQELFEELQSKSDGASTQFRVPEHLASIRREVETFPNQPDVDALLKDSDVDAMRLAYYTGVWLGDDTSVRSNEIAVDVNDSPEIVEFLEDTAAALGLHAHRRVDAGRAHVIAMHPSTEESVAGSASRKRCNRLRENQLQQAMTAIGVDSTKRIPSTLLGASRQIRLAVLAGLVDSDGYLEAGAHRYNITQKRHLLALDIVRLARSLGLSATIHERTITNQSYWRVRLSGDLAVIPAKLPRKQADPAHKAGRDYLRYTTSIESIGEGEYYGFQCASFAQSVTTSQRLTIAASLKTATDIDMTAAPFIIRGDLLASLANGEQAVDGSFPGRFLLANHTVVHNTYSVAMFVAACAYALEGTTQAIFSTGRRASKKLLDLIYQFLCKLPGMKESIITKNVEEIRIQGPGGDDDVRTICSYPSKVR